jgi:hypothetical protein
MQFLCQTPTVTFLPVSKTRKPHFFRYAIGPHNLLKNNAKNLFRHTRRLSTKPLWLYQSPPPCPVRAS